MSLPLHEEVIKALEKAEDAIEQAEYNLQSDFSLVTANRAYYAVYYLITGKMQITTLIQTSLQKKPGNLSQKLLSFCN